MLVAFIVVRTAYFTRVETPEPRYVLVYFPAVLALAALRLAGAGLKLPNPKTNRGSKLGKTLLLSMQLVAASIGVLLQRLANFSEFSAIYLLHKKKQMRGHKIAAHQ